MNFNRERVHECPVWDKVDQKKGFDTIKLKKGQVREFFSSFIRHFKAPPLDLPLSTSSH